MKRQGLAVLSVIALSLLAALVALLLRAAFVAVAAAVMFVRPPRGTRRAV